MKHSEMHSIFILCNYKKLPAIYFVSSFLSVSSIDGQNFNFQTSVNCSFIDLKLLGRRKTLGDCSEISFLLILMKITTQNNEKITTSRIFIL